MQRLPSNPPRFHFVGVATAAFDSHMFGWPATHGSAWQMKQSGVPIKCSIQNRCLQLAPVSVCTIRIQDKLKQWSFTKQKFCNKTYVCAQSCMHLACSHRVINVCEWHSHTYLHILCTSHCNMHCMACCGFITWPMLLRQERINHSFSNMSSATLVSWLKGNKAGKQWTTKKNKEKADLHLWQSRPWSTQCRCTLLLEWSDTLPLWSPAYHTNNVSPTRQHCKLAGRKKCCIAAVLENLPQSRRVTKSADHGTTTAELMQTSRSFFTSVVCKPASAI